MNGMIAAAEGDAALVAIDDARGDPETEPSAIEFFGGVEGFEDPRLHCMGHAVAGVGDGDANPLVGIAVETFGSIVSANKKPSSLSHGIDRVGDEVVQDLPDIVFKAVDGLIGAKAGIHVDAGVEQAALIQVEYGFDKILRGDVGCADCLTMKAQRLGRNLADPREFALSDVDVLRKLRRKLG